MEDTHYEPPKIVIKFSEDRLTWASIDSDACSMILCVALPTTSSTMSASRIRDSAFVIFSDAFVLTECAFTDFPCEYLCKLKKLPSVSDGGYTNRSVGQVSTTHKKPDKLNTKEND